MGTHSVSMRAARPGPTHLQGAAVIIQPFLDRLPFIAILRGVSSEEVVPVTDVLVEAGFTIIEIPLNSPRPMESITRLVEKFGDELLIGAGTVTTPAQVDEVAEAGGRLVVMPHSDREVVRASKEAELACIPGVATPTEGFAALANGADALKLFPAELLTPTVLKAMKTIFPSTTRFLPVGGITPDSMASYVAAGAAGFGLGAALYRRGDDPARVATNARDFVAAWKRIRGVAGG